MLDLLYIMWFLSKHPNKRHLFGSRIGDRSRLGPGFLKILKSDRVALNFTQLGQILYPILCDLPELSEIECHSTDLGLSIFEKPGPRRINVGPGSPESCVRATHSNENSC